MDKKNTAVNSSSSTNNRKSNGTSPGRKFLRSIISNLSRAQEENVFPKHSTLINHQNESNNYSNCQVKIDDTHRTKKNGVEYSYTPPNSVNYEPLKMNRTSTSNLNNNNRNRVNKVPTGLLPKTLSILEALSDLNLEIEYGDDYEKPPLNTSTTTTTLVNNENRILKNQKLSFVDSSIVPNIDGSKLPHETSTSNNNDPSPAFLNEKNQVRTSLMSASCVNQSPRKSLSRTSNDKMGTPPNKIIGKYLKNDKLSYSPKRSQNTFYTDNNFSVSSSTCSPSQNKLKHKTPNWIWKIFQLTKNGRLNLLKEALYGLDLTMIRHMVDVKGNTLLHCSVQNGHVHIVEWLGSMLGEQFEAALNDQNRNGRSVILLALKNNQLECLQWLILNTITGNNALAPKDGKKSLLHQAAKYNLVEATRLLCEFHSRCQTSIDIQDSRFFTPLHTAAKFGNINIAQVLIQFGADTTCQTELGYRPSDLALKYHHQECVSYFRMVEAAASLGNDFYSVLTQFNILQVHFETLRTHFREILRVSKCLAKERNDLIKHFPFTESSKSSPEAVAIPSSLLLGGTTTNGVRFSDLEHKIVQAEHIWKQIETHQQHAENGATSKFSPTDLKGQENAKSLFTLQKYLEETQLQCDKRNKTSSTSNLLMSSSSSEENSSDSVTSSENEDIDDDDDYGQEASCQTRDNEPTYYNVSQCHKNKNISCSYLPSSSSSSTPWLLPSSEASILASLSPEKALIKNGDVKLSNLDLLNSVPSTSQQHSFKEESIAPKMSSFSSSSSTVGGPAQQTSTITTATSSTLNSVDVDPSSAAAVIEVIEPLCTNTNKTINGCLTTDVTFTSSKHSSNNNFLEAKKLSHNRSRSENPIENPKTESSKSLSCTIENERQTFESVRRFEARELNKGVITTSPHESTFHYNATADNVNETEEIFLRPDLIRGTHDHDYDYIDVDTTNNNRNFDAYYTLTHQHTPKRQEVVRKDQIGLPDSGGHANDVKMEIMRHLDIFQSKKPDHQTRPQSSTFQISCTQAEKEKCQDCQNEICSHDTMISSNQLPSSFLAESSNETSNFKNNSLFKITTSSTFKNPNSIATTIGNFHPSNVGSHLKVLPETEIIFPIGVEKQKGNLLQKRTSDNLNYTSSANTSSSPSSYSSITPSTRQHSSVSDSSFNATSSAFIKPNWTLVDLPESSPLDSTKSHQSPSPSETESTQISHYSELSKTESIIGSIYNNNRHSSNNLPAEEPSEEMPNNNNSNNVVINYCQFVTTSPSQESQSMMMMSGIESKKQNLFDQHERKNFCDNNQERKNDKIDNNASRSESKNDDDDKGCAESSITQPVIRVHSTTPAALTNATTYQHHQPPFYNNNINGLIKVPKRPPKPWYEIEMSDDEDESLLRIARARSRSSHSHRPSCSDESEIIEPDVNVDHHQRQQQQQQQHECSSTSCSQYNCPNFV